MRGQKFSEMCLPRTRYKDHFSQPGAWGDTVGKYLRGRFVMAVCAFVRVIRAALTIHGGGDLRFRAHCRLAERGQARLVPTADGTIRGLTG
jgi:hypothetical protein